MNQKNAEISSLDPERFAMSALVKSLTELCFVSSKMPSRPSRETEHESSIIDRAHLARLDVLKYGYSSRTYQTLATHFPRFRASLGEDKWRDLGQAFAESDAFMSAQLGLLPARFFQWLRGQDLSEPQTLSYQIDHAVFEIGLEDFYQFKKLDFNILDEQSVVMLRPTVRLIAIDTFSYVVSRNSEEVFVENTPAHWLKTLDQSKDAVRCLSLSERFSASEDFGLFLASSLRYDWLAIV